ncbi:MAG: class I adenylate-forming enzyme family protein [Smithella sp.]|nr:class I adenylate-forming enzyme family protein [Smithella sp.]
MQQPTLIHHFLEASAERLPDKIALIHEQTRATYSEINAKANRLARALAGLGVKRGDRVVILLHNGLEYITSYFGVLKTGAVFVSLGTDTKPDKLAPLLIEIDPVVLISSDRFESLLAETPVSCASLKAMILSRPKAVWVGMPFPVMKLEELFDSGDDTNPGLAVDPEDLACLIYTSGSTGTPKGAMLSHFNIVNNTSSICTYLKLTSDDRQMVVLPFFYVMGKSLLNTHFAVGGSIVLNNKFAYTGAVIKQMIDEKVTGMSGVPSTFAYLLHRSPLAASRDKLESLRYCSQAGGHMSRQIKEDLRKALPDHTDIFIMYGATEASARLSYLETSEFGRKIDSIGKAIPNVTLRVLDEGGNEVPPGQTGELTASGPNIMSGYWKDPETTARVLDANGYHTGDLAYMDEEGYFYLVGRKDNLLKVSGHRINPQEIEDVIMESGLIVEVAVIGKPDELKGNKLIAVAVPIESSCTAHSLIEFCSAKLPKFKVPDDVIFTRALPKKASGKIDRKGCSGLI